MITQGQIVNINKTTVSVRVPVFETTGSSEKIILDCNICYVPGNLNNYRIDDKVYVTFANNNFNEVIVLGKIFTGNETDAVNFSFNNSLKVSGNTELSKNTKIGDINYQQIAELVKNKDAIIDSKGTSGSGITEEEVNNLINLAINNLKQELESGAIDIKATAVFK